MTSLIYTRDTTDEVQGKLGYDRWQWKEFLKFTKEEAERLLQDRPDVSWPSCNYEERQIVQHNISSKMRAPIRKDALDWRMPKIISNLKPKKPKAEINASPPPPPQGGEAAAPAEDTTDPEPSNTRHQYYDPVREI